MATIDVDLIAALGSLTGVLEACNVRYALIGGLAKAAWSRARATRDIDIAVVVDAAGLHDLQARLRASAFSIVTTVGGEPDDARPDIFVARSSNGIAVDVLIAKTPFEEEAVAQSVPLDLLGHRVQVVTAEDLVFYKLLAGRPRDRDDILDVIQTRLAAAQAFDWLRLEHLAREWGVEAELASIRRAIEGS